MDTVYEFTAYNTEKIYGWGSEEEARLYLDWLNQKREINQYGMAESDLTAEQADTLAIHLRDCLGDLGLIEAGDN